MTVWWKQLGWRPHSGCHWLCNYSRHCVWIVMYALSLCEGAKGCSYLCRIVRALFLGVCCIANWDQDCPESLCPICWAQLSLAGHWVGMQPGRKGRKWHRQTRACLNIASVTYSGNIHHVQHYRRHVNVPHILHVFKQACAAPYICLLQHVHLRGLQPHRRQSFCCAGTFENLQELLHRFAL